MLFNSLQFALFFPLVLLGHYLLPAKARWIWMLAAGHVFYMALVPWYVLILWGAILVDWSLGIAIEGTASKRRKDAYLWLSVVATCSLLFVFKYAGFAARLAQPLADLFHLPLPLIELALPIGLSFHTFQSLSYVIEVHQGRFPAERHLGHYALYVLFFPQLVAGPIERPQNLLPQLRRFPDFEEANLVRGLRRMLWGFFLKVGVADRLAPAADAAFAQPEGVSSLALALGVAAFSAQIYCDFLGYTEIARGTAETLGIRLVPNYDRPWRSFTPSQFWRRWHISLTNWFRDYVYIPLGGNRKGRAVKTVLLLFTFSLSGLWHGAGTGFILWGLYNGLCLVLENLILPRRWEPGTLLSKVLAWSTTFLLMALGRGIFRASANDSILPLFRGLAAGSASSLGTVLAELRLSPTEAGLGILAAGATGIMHHVSQGDPSRWIAGQRTAVRWIWIWGCLFFLLFLGALDGQRFVYFQF